MPKEIAEDPRQWLLDELLAEASDVQDTLATIEQRQAAEIRRSLDQLTRLRSQVSLTPFEEHEVNRSITALRAALIRRRTGCSD